MQSAASAPPGDVLGDPLEAFAEKYLPRGGAGFYLQDAYLQYVLWMQRQVLKPILGKNRMCWQLESLGYDRTSRRGLIFFQGARLTVGSREVYDTLRSRDV